MAIKRGWWMPTIYLWLERQSISLITYSIRNLFGLNALHENHKFLPFLSVCWGVFFFIYSISMQAFACVLIKTNIDKYIDFMISFHVWQHISNEWQHLIMRSGSSHSGSSARSTWFKITKFGNKMLQILCHHPIKYGQLNKDRRNQCNTFTRIVLLRNFFFFLPPTIPYHTSSAFRPRFIFTF